MPATTSLGFRNRPVDPDYAISQQISRSLRGGRNYQRQHLCLTGGYIQGNTIASGGFTGYSLLTLLPGDVVVSAVVNVTAMSGGTYDLELNTVLQGASLGGPWTAAPAAIDFRAFALPNAETPASSRIFFRLKNTGAGSIAYIEFQPLIVVLR